MLTLESVDFSGTFTVQFGTLFSLPVEQPADMEGILKVTKFPRAHLFGLRRDGTGRRVAGASFEEATQGSLCESIRAGQMVEHALLLHISEEVKSRHGDNAPGSSRNCAVRAGITVCRSPDTLSFTSLFAIVR